MAKQHQNPRYDLDDFKEYCRERLANSTECVFKAISQNLPIKMPEPELAYFYQKCTYHFNVEYNCYYNNEAVIKELLNETPKSITISQSSHLSLLKKYLINLFAPESKLESLSFNPDCIDIAATDADIYCNLIHEFLALFANHKGLKFLDMFVLFDNKNTIGLLNSALKTNQALNILRLKIIDSYRFKTPPNFNSLSNNQSLHILHVSTQSKGVIRDILSHLLSNKHLENVQLIFIGGGYDIICCRDLALGMLSESSALTELEIEGVHFKNLDPDCTFGLDKTSKLETLIFGMCQVPSATAIAKALATNSVLRKLVLPDIKTDNFVEELAKSLSKNSTLTDLDIIPSNIRQQKQSGCYKPLFEVMYKPCFLQRLSLFMLNFDVEAAQIIGKMLSLNTTLLTLELNHTIINFEEMKHIFTCLMNNNKLKDLINVNLIITSDQIDEFKTLFQKLMKVNNVLINIYIRVPVMSLDRNLHYFIKRYLIHNKIRQLDLKMIAARHFIKFVDKDYRTFNKIIPVECSQLLKIAKDEYKKELF